jgi:hypothetical protein
MNRNIKDNQKEKEQVKLPLIKKNAALHADWTSKQLDIYEIKDESLKIGSVGFWIQSSKK